MSLVNRLALVGFILAVVAVGGLVMAAAFVLETEPIFKNLTFGVGVFVIGCAAAMWAAYLEAA